MKKIMSDYREKTRKEFPLPESVQQLIPIVKISADGIFQLEKGSEEEEKQYDRAYLFDDTNYSTMDEAEKTDFLKLYVSVLNTMNIPFKKRSGRGCFCTPGMRARKSTQKTSIPR